MDQVLPIGEVVHGVAFHQQDADAVVADPKTALRVFQQTPHMQEASGFLQAQCLVVQQGEVFAIETEDAAVGAQPKHAVSATGRTRGQVGAGGFCGGTVRIGQVVQRLPIPAVHARLVARVEPQVPDGHLPHSRMLLQGGGRDGGDALAGFVSAYATSRPEPDASVFILLDGPYLLIGQPVLDGVVGHRGAIVAAYAFGVTAEPVVALAVLQDGAYAREEDGLGASVEVRSTFW